MDRVKVLKVDVERREREPFVLPPDPYATIWRYLDFTKFVSLLATSELFFAPTSTFEDQCEGSYAPSNIAAREQYWASFGAEDAVSMAASHAELARELPRWVFANCWSVSDVESAAFWNLYAPPSGGVAIRSSLQRLADCFDAGNSSERSPDPLYLGMVSYLDFEKDLIPESDLLYPFVHKRRSFEFESELRAVIPHFPETDDPDGRVGSYELQENRPPAGLTVPVDLFWLIEAIYVSPFAPSWFFELVSSVVDQYGCGGEVIQSSLSDAPVF